MSGIGAGIGMGEAEALNQPLTPADAVPLAAANCKDCGAPISGKYCSNCGQETTIEVPTVRQFVHELMDQYVAVEGKLGRTLRVLLTQPGQLTLDYVHGRRQRYVRPLKLYVSISVVFFGLIGILPDSIGNPFTRAEPPPPPPPSMRPAAPAAAAGIGQNLATPATDGASATANRDPAAASPPAPAQPAAPPAPAAAPEDESLDLRQRIHQEIEADVENGQAAAIGDDIKREVEAERHLSATERKKRKGLAALASPEQRKELRAKLADDAPYAMFFLMPYFALLLRWLYRSNKQRYGVHLLFTVHLHCFAFILLMVMFLPLSLLRTALELAGALYVFLALRRVYGGTWKQTVWRMAVLAFLDFVAISATTLSGVMSVVFGSST